MEEKSTPGVFEALWRYRVSSLAIVVIAVALSVVVSGLVSGRHATATAKMVLATPTEFDPVGVSAPTEPTFDRYVGQRAIFATSNQVLTAAAKALGGSADTDSLRKNVTATAAANGEAISVTARAGSAARAADIANAVVQSYEDASLAQVQASGTSALAAISSSRAQLVQAGNSASAAIVSLDQQGNSIKIAMAQFGSGVTFVDKATSGAATSASFSTTTAAIGLILGFLIAATVAWMRADRDRRVRSSASVGDLVDAPQLGEVALRSDAAAAGLWQVRSAPAADYALVVAGLQARVDRGVVLVSSATRGEGRSVTALQIAVGAARDGRRVLLVDADPQSSELSVQLGLDGKQSGFGAVTSGQSSLDEATYVIDLGHDNQIWAVPAGAVIEGSAAVHSADLARLLASMKQEYDLVVIDGDAGVGSPQLATIARHCDGVLVVVRRGTPTQEVSRLARRLDLFGAPQLGFVLIGTDARHESVTQREPGPVDLDLKPTPARRLTDTSTG